jgi:hypothetical protein
MSFLNKKIKDFFKKSKMGVIALIAFFGLAGVAFGQIDIGTTIPIPTEESLSVGEIWGYGWMGTGIINQSSSQGGGGWLKFNCSPENCRPEQDLWGVNVVMDEDDARYGWLYGEAWSNNYGWLVFEPDLTSSCWEANPAETANSTARVIFNDASTKSPIVGWGKFVAGDDSMDGWDGCVSFSGVEYGVLVDTVTGALSGWAWGGPVVGWISFQNPECPFCNTTLLIDDTTVTPPTEPPPVPVRGCTNPLAINYNPLATIDDGSCIVRPNNNRPNINLEVEPGQFFVGSGDYTIDSITWTSTNPSQIEPGSCKGFLTVDGGLTPTLSGWSGVRPDPNSSISNIYLNYAENAGPGTVFEFLIKCLSTTGADVSDTDTIIMVRPTVPTGPSPRLNLRIQSPETVISPGTSFEIIPADGLDVTLGWDGSSINWNSCVGTSQKLDSNGSDVGINSQWENSNEYNSGIGQLVVDMTSPNNYTTWYTLTCESSAGDQTLNRSVLVCVSGSSCPQTGGGRPGYQEF